MHNIGFFINMNYINKREYCVVWKITRDAHNNHINVNSIRKKQDLGFSPLKRRIISKFVGRELARYEYQVSEHFRCNAGKDPFGSMGTRTTIADSQ